jgi:hypothetical protein
VIRHSPKQSEQDSAHRDRFLNEFKCQTPA